MHVETAERPSELAHPAKQPSKLSNRTIFYRTELNVPKGDLFLKF